MQAFLNGVEPNRTVTCVAQCRTPPLMWVDNQRSAAQAQKSNSVRAISSVIAQHNAVPVSVPSHGHAARVFSSQQHFVDVLRQLEARKAQLQQQADLQIPAAPPTAMAHTLAPSTSDAGAKTSSGQGLKAAGAVAKCSANAASDPLPRIKRQKVVRIFHVRDLIGIDPGVPKSADTGFCCRHAQEPGRVLLGRSWLC